MDAEELLALAQQALDEGTSLAEVEQMVNSAATRAGLAGDLGLAFRNRVEAAELKQESELLGRVAERGVAANIGLQLAQGASFGTIDDILEAFGGPGEEFRIAQEEGAEAVPGGAMAAQVAGGLLLPGLGTIQAGRGVAAGGRALGGAITNLGARTGGGLLGRGAASTLQTAGRAVASPVTAGAATAAGVGATGAGLFAFGEATGPIPERFEQARGAATDPLVVGASAVFGAGAGRVGPRMRRMFGARGPRVARELEEATGISRDINQFRTTAEEATERVRQRFFQPLDRAFPEVNDPQIRGLLERIRRRPDAVPALNAVSREVARDLRPPSFSELQDLNTRLRGRGLRDEADELIGFMEGAFPRFREGRRAFRQARSVEEAVDIGLGRQGRFEGKRIRVQTPADVERALEALPVEAHDAFRTGLLHKEISALQGAERGGSPAILKRLIDDANTDGRLRQMFPDDASAENFIQAVRTERGSQALAASFRKWGGRIALIGGGAGLGAAIF